MPRGARLHGCGGVREGGVLANHLDLFRTPSALYPATLYGSEATVYCSCGMAPRGFLILSFPLVVFWALIVAGCLCFVSVASFSN